MTLDRISNFAETTLMLPNVHLFLSDAVEIAEVNNESVNFPRNKFFVYNNGVTIAYFIVEDTITYAVGFLYDNDLDILGKTAPVRGQTYDCNTVLNDIYMWLTTGAYPYIDDAIPAFDCG